MVGATWSLFPLLSEAVWEQPFASPISLRGSRRNLVASEGAEGDTPLRSQGYLAPPLGPYNRPMPRALWWS